MDRSYLSHAGVIAASREFVCIRPLTYENAAEAPYLESLFRGRSGNLENTARQRILPTAAGTRARDVNPPPPLYNPASAPARLQDGRWLASKALGISRPGPVHGPSSQGGKTDP